MSAVVPGAPVERLQVFISYSRKDSDFAQYVGAALKLAGMELALDRYDILPAEFWERRIEELIAGSDAVVFVMSPSSLQSTRCSEELEHAAALNKKIIPVEWGVLGGHPIPDALSSRNFIAFKPGESFAEAMAKLESALRQDANWVHQHTQLRQAAQRWDTRGRRPNDLLYGSRVQDAVAWMNQRADGSAAVSPLIIEFIGASDAEKIARENELVRIAQRDARRTKIGLLIVGVIAVAAMAAAVAAVRQTAVANQQREAAEAARRSAEAAWEKGNQAVVLIREHPAGRRAMEKTCREAIDRTATLATSASQTERQAAEDRFWELYYANMFLVEMEQVASEGAKGVLEPSSTIEAAMVRFGHGLDASKQGSGSRDALCPLAKVVRAECIEHLRLTDVPETCPGR